MKVRNLPLTGIICSLLVSCSSAPTAGPGATTPPPVPVSVAQATEEMVPIQVRSVGNVEAYSSVGVKALVGGQLLSVKFAEGANVAAGDLLFEIDSRPFREALRQTEAVVRKDEAELRVAEANIARDQARLKNAQAESQPIRATLEGRHFDTQPGRRVSHGSRSRCAIGSSGPGCAGEHPRVTGERAVRCRAGEAESQLYRRFEHRSPAGPEICCCIPAIWYRPMETSRWSSSTRLRRSMSLSVFRNAISARSPRGRIPGKSLRSRSSLRALRNSIRGTLSVIDNTVDPTTGTIRLKGSFRESKPPALAGPVCECGDDAGDTTSDRHSCRSDSGRPAGLRLFTW